MSFEFRYDSITLLIFVYSHLSHFASQFKWTAPFHLSLCLMTWSPLPLVLCPFSFSGDAVFPLHLYMVRVLTSVCILFPFPFRVHSWPFIFASYLCHPVFEKFLPPFLLKIYLHLRISFSAQQVSNLEMWSLGPFFVRFMFMFTLLKKCTNQYAT